jgi:DNA (cytosine-5)-methyltransferase 1
MNKPPYRVPSMTEIAAIPWNGFSAASTFSGCGGSSLGYRMAGFRILYANEFIPAAQDSYRANAAPYTFLDTRDIRQVQPQDILEKIGLAPGELDLFDGSPPCASFSTAGKREAGWGKVKKYSDSEQRTDDLFFEFARLLRGLQPKTFVAENVSGLVKGTAKGYFLEILRELKSCGYNVACKVLDAQWLGVPQARQRTIFVGVRNNLGLAPAHPRPLPYRYCLADILIAGERSEREADISSYCTGREWEKLSEGEQSKKYFNLVKTDRNLPCPTICASHGSPGIASVTHPTEKRKFSIAEIKRICGFPDDFRLIGTYPQQWERCGRSVPPVMMSHIAATIRDEILLKL